MTPAAAEAFYQLVEGSIAAQPAWFTELELPASEGEVHAAEAVLGVAFPTEYRDFLLRIGGGYFAKANILTVGLVSDWNIVRFNRRIPSERSFLAVADDETGGYFGFLRKHHVCDTAVYHLDPEVLDAPVFVAADFRMFVRDVALSGLIMQSVPPTP